MKKILFLLFISFLFLAGCGTGELKSFASDFNEVVENEDINEINPDDFGEIEEEDDFGIQTLYESDRYSIEANYDDSKKLTGYMINIDANDPFEQLEGDGYKASVSTAKALDLSPRDFANNFEKALMSDHHSYKEDDYEIRFSNIGYDLSVDMGMLVTFEKQ